MIWTIFFGIGMALCGASWALVHGTERYNLAGGLAIAGALMIAPPIYLQPRYDVWVAAIEAEADIVRAEGVARASEIIGSEDYLMWRYIEMLERTGGLGQ